MNALRSLALHDRSSEDAYKILVYVVKCPGRVKSSDQTMSNEKTRREEKNKRTAAAVVVEIEKVLTVCSQTQTTKSFVFSSCRLFKLHPIVNNKTI